MCFVPCIDTSKLTKESLKKCTNFILNHNKEENSAYGFLDDLTYGCLIKDLDISYTESGRKALERNDFIDALFGITLQPISSTILRYAATEIKIGTTILEFIENYNELLKQEIEAFKHSIHKAYGLKAHMTTNEELVFLIGYTEEFIHNHFNGKTYKLTLKNGKLEWVCIEDYTSWRTRQEWQEKLPIKKSRELLALSDLKYKVPPNSLRCASINNPNSRKPMDPEEFVKKYYSYIDGIRWGNSVNDDKYVIKKIRFNRSTDNLKANTFDFIEIEVSICTPKEERMEYIKKNRQKIHATAIMKLTSSGKFQKAGVPINFFEMYDSTLTQDGMYIMKLQLKNALYQT